MSKRNAAGQGTIRKRSDGRWEGIASIEIDGIKKKKSVYGKTQKEAREKLQQVLMDSKNGILIETESVSLENWLFTWLNVYKKVTLKQTTFENYMLNYNTHIKGSNIGKLPINKLTATLIQNFYNNKASAGSNRGEGLSASTIKHLHILISGALEDAVRKSMINKNPAKLTILPKKRKQEIIPLTEKEVGRFLTEAKNDRLYALYVLEIFTGLRRGEILALQWSDIDFKQKRIKVTKTLSLIKANEEDMQETGKKNKLVLTPPKTEKSIRTIPIQDNVIKILKEHRKLQGLEKMRYADIYNDLNMVFAKEDGNFIYARDFLRQYQNILKKAGIEKKRFHDLRHTFATILINENENPRVIQELLGHSTITTTMDVYSHVLESTKKKSVEKIYNKFEEIG